MNASVSTSTAVYAGVNEPAASPDYLFAPLIVLGAGLVVLVLALSYFARAEHREITDSDSSFFDHQ